MSTPYGASGPNPPIVPDTETRVAWLEGEVDRLIAENETARMNGYGDGWHAAHEAAPCGHAHVHWRDPNWGTPDYDGDETCDVCDAEAERDLHREINRGVSAALGQEKAIDGVLRSWHDLPEKVAAVVAGRNRLRDHLQGAIYDVEEILGTLRWFADELQDFGGGVDAFAKHPLGDMIARVRSGSVLQCFDLDAARAALAGDSSE